MVLVLALSLKSFPFSPHLLILILGNTLAEHALRGENSLLGSKRRVLKTKRKEKKKKKKKKTGKGKREKKKRNKKR